MIEQRFRYERKHSDHDLSHPLSYLFGLLSTARLAIWRLR